MHKNHILILCFVFFSFGKINGQRVDRSFFKAGFNAAAAIGDASDLANLGVGLDLYQHWGVSKKFDLGITAGAMNFFRKRVPSSYARTSV